MKHEVLRPRLRWPYRALRKLLVVLAITAAATGTAFGIAWCADRSWRSAHRGPAFVPRVIDCANAEVVERTEFAMETLRQHGSMSLKKLVRMYGRDAVACAIASVDMVCNSNSSATAIAPSDCVVYALDKP